MKKHDKVIYALVIVILCVCGIICIIVVHAFFIIIAFIVCGVITDMVICGTRLKELV